MTSSEVDQHMEKYWQREAERRGVSVEQAKQQCKEEEQQRDIAEKKAREVQRRKKFTNLCMAQGISKSQLAAVNQEHPALEKWLDLIDDYIKGEPCSLLMTGPSGNGKTSVAVAIYVWFAFPRMKRGIECLYWNSEDFYQRWRTVSLENNLESWTRELREAELLVLDDIGRGTVSDAHNNFLYGVLDYRVNHEKRTVITTNLSGKQLEEAFGNHMISRMRCGHIWKFKETKDHRIKDSVVVER